MKNGISPALFPELVSKGGKEGILPWQEIKRMVSVGQISANPEPLDSQIQPASIDLRLGSVAYRTRASFLRGRSATFLTRVQEFTEATIDLTEDSPALLDPGIVYIIPLIESLNLPTDVQGVANPKSTTGRLDIFTRLITEHGDSFDRVPKGYKGALFAEVSPRSFPIRVRREMRLNQLRFVRGNATQPITNGDLKQIAESENLVYDSKGNPAKAGIADGIEITADLEGGVVAYRAKNEAPRVVELDRYDYYEPEDYWEPIKPRHGHITLAKGAFYLLASKRLFSVPLDYAAEMVAHDPSMGEFRVHYAGFFDPGFGYGMRKGDILGTKAVLEVRAYEVDIVLEDNHVIGRLHYYKMAERPEKTYGEAGLSSSYQKQGLALSKQFKRPDVALRNTVPDQSPVTVLSNP
ncbi:MAG TPA: 2'-deoxycytidine 5'-triphosphate deaminase [Terriglobales bacterium]|nr:2'-deoxycytidine 5'-triphosphate deaminase [Terriglobales bacterium]